MRYDTIIVSYLSRKKRNLINEVPLKLFFIYFQSQKHYQQFLQR